jgi:phosphate/sulfate permease
MERKIIELALPTEEAKRVYVYEKNGLAERKRSDLDVKDFDEFEYDIVIPEEIVTASSSYVDGLFKDSVYNISDQASFFNKYRIVGDDSNAENSFIKEIYFLYNEKFFVDMRKSKEEELSGLTHSEDCKSESEPKKEFEKKDLKAIFITIYICSAALNSYWLGIYTRHIITSLIQVPIIAFMMTILFIYYRDYISKPITKWIISKLKLK